jgi:hypothetical protein
MLEKEAQEEITRKSVYSWQYALTFRETKKAKPPLDKSWCVIA